MLKRFAPLVPLALSFLLVACAGHSPTPHSPSPDVALSESQVDLSAFQGPEKPQDSQEWKDLASGKPFQLQRLHRLPVQGRGRHAIAAFLPGYDQYQRAPGGPHRAGTG